MKTGLKIVKCKDGLYIARKKWWFGLWLYFNEVYDGNWCCHYEWLPWEPTESNSDDRFSTKKQMLEKLQKYYHGHRSYKDIEK